MQDGNFNNLSLSTGDSSRFNPSFVDQQNTLNPNHSITALPIDQRELNPSATSPDSDEQELSYNKSQNLTDLDQISSSLDIRVPQDLPVTSDNYLGE